MRLLRRRALRSGAKTYVIDYVIREKRVVFLLCGGDKRSESADIKRAVELAREV